ncbi:MAG: hypothetical protein HY322_02210 [Betaproteobacteria bacterium]|nr:hypothetical protein [Betaproteobacteria bacterium]
MNRATMERWWPWALTAIVILAGIVALVIAPKLETLSQIGDFFSGFAGTLAFIWLVAAYFMQGQELRLQRQELAMQRQSMEQQRNEWKKIGKYAALEQVARILDQYDASLSRGSVQGVRSITDLPTAYMNGMKLWNTITEGSDPNAVFEAHTKWLPIDSGCEEFLNRFVSAVEMYEGATDSVVLPAAGSSIQRVYFAPDALLSIPIIRHYSGTAKLLATHLLITEPGRDLLKLKGFEATEKLFPGIMFGEAIAEVRARVQAREAERAKAKAK